ncbi:MAG: LuxR C-terminal-related transcriptional regulator [Terriglobia bacterium]
MEHLGQRELRALLEFVRETYALRNYEAFVRQIVAGISRLVPAEFTAYCEMNPRHAESRNWFDPPDAVLPLHEEVWQQHMTEHAVLAHIVRTGDGQALKISDFQTRRQYQRTGLYDKLYRPLNVQDVLCVEPVVRVPRVAGIALSRDRRSFTEQERLLLNLVRPHLAQAWRNAKKISRLEQQLRLLDRAVEEAGRGVIILDRRGQVRFLSTEAKRLLHEYFGSSWRRGGQLPADLERWIRCQQELPTASEVPPPRAALTVQLDGRRLEVRLLSEADQSLLLLEEQRESCDPAFLKPLGLTAREAEVLAWVARGKTNAEIGAILGLSPRTVQKHLERVFSKLGVENRTAAASIALQMMRKANSG